MDQPKLEPIAQPDLVASTPAESKPPITATDLLKRSVDSQATQLKSDTPAQFKFNPDEILANSGITDEKVKSELKLKLEERYKLAEKGISEKFESLSKMKKEIESITNNPGAIKWTPELIAKLESSPEFRAAALQRLQARQATAPPTTWPGSEDEWSALSDTDKRRFNELTSTVSMLVQDREQELNQKEHESLKSKFPGYDPSLVEQTQSDILAGRFSQQEIKEMIYKAKVFDQQIEQAYKFGLEDRNAQIETKLSGATVTTDNPRPPKEEFVPSTGSTLKQGFIELARRTLAEQKKVGTR